MRLILKSGNKILRTGNKILSVGAPRPPVLDFNPHLLTLNEGEKVAIVPDSSGTKNHARQLIEANQPIFRKNIVASHSAIEFTANGMGFDIDNTLDPKTIFIVRNAPVFTYGSMLGYTPGVYQQGKAGSFLGDNTGAGLNFRTLAYNPPHWAAVSQNRLYENAILQDKNLSQQKKFWTLLTLDVTDDLRYVNIIANEGFDNGYWTFKGLIARIIIYNYRLTEIDRQAIENSLLQLYAL